MASTTIEPNRLKSRWPIAVRLAATFPLSDARIGVIVVPMLPPRIMAQPRENEIQPCEHIISVMAKVAAELCATIAKKSEGDFRLVRNMMLLLEKAAKAAENFTVDRKMLDLALSAHSWRRK